jgi:hypothetical protein
VAAQPPARRENQNMNSRQAKDILVLYRPGTSDREEPEIAAAMALAQSDPELGRWFQDHCVSQTALRANFKGIPVPEGLKEQILSERKAHAALPLPRRLALVAAAIICLLLVAGIALSLLSRREDRSFTNFQSRMVRTVARLYPKMDLETSDLGKIRQYLAAHQAPGDYQLPAQLEKTSGTGCAVLQWRGKSVSMICFNSGATGNPTQPDLFLFVINRSNVPNPPPAGSPQFGQSSRLATATWSSGDKTYLLAGMGDEAFLRRYF